MAPDRSRARVRLVLLGVLVASPSIAFARPQEGKHAALLAGEELRGPALGEVRDASGNPWSGIEVVLRSRPVPANADFGEPDCVLATTDARGRFRAQVLRGRPYSVWAWGEPGPGGRPATAVAERVFVQRPVLLREARTLPKRRLVLTATGRWAQCQGFAVRIVDHTGNREVTWLDVNEGASSLPWIVGDEAFVEVFGKLDGRRVPLVRERIGASDGAGDLRIELPNAQRVTCWVRNVTEGEPAAGAEVFRRLGDTLFPAGTTDAAGKLVLDLPEGPGHVGFATLALAEGSSFGICQRAGSVHAPIRVDLPEGIQPDDLFVNLTNEAAVHARFVDPRGQPLAGLEVWSAGIATNRFSSSSAAYDNWQRSVMTDARGEVVLGGLPADSRHSPQLILRERDSALLPPSWRSGLAPVVFAPLVGQPGTGTKDDPFVVDLHRMCPVEFTLTEAGGAPAEDVGLNFTSLQEWVGDVWARNQCSLQTDQRGRSRVLVPGGQRLGFRAVRGLSMLIRAFETTRGRVGEGPAVARFTLPPPTGIRGRVLEKSGAPGRGRTVHASFDQPLECSDEIQDVAPMAPPGRNGFRVLQPQAEVERLRLGALISFDVATDDDGGFALPMPAEPMPTLVLFTGKLGAKAFSGGIRVPWFGTTQDDVELQLRW